MAVLDASLVAAALLPTDVHFIRAQRWLRANAGPRFERVAPMIMLSEVAAACQRAQQPAAGSRAIRALLRPRLVRLEPIDHELGEAAALVAIAFGLKGCDAIYVALAIRTAQPLITFDRQQAARGARAGATVVEPT